MRRSFTRPRVVLSKCLELEPVRYNGQRIPDSFIRRLIDFVDFVPVCPEVEIGLGVPREPVRLVAATSGETRLVQPATGRDLTERMNQFARRYLEGLGPVDGFILKAGSPSCGTSNVKVYQQPEPSPTVRREPGMFARHVLETHGDFAVEDEGRLRNFPIRHHFLTRLFAFAELRELEQSDDPEILELIEFHRQSKELLLAYREEELRALGRLVSNPHNRDVRDLLAEYTPRFRRALADMPSRKRQVNVLVHMYGHFKDRLRGPERHDFLALVEAYRNHHTSLMAPIALLRSWCARYDYDYLADQRYLEPYPRELIQMRDSGKGFDF